MAKGKTDFIFQRPGSENWWIKLRSGGRRIEKSLGTPVRAVAEIMALPMIAEHKAKLLEARPRLQSSWQPRYEPGREHPGPDGGRIIATERELIYLDASGRITGKTDNGGVAFQLVSGDKLLVRSITEAYPKDSEADAITRFFRSERPTKPPKDGDDALLETYLKHANIIGYYEREARDVWALYKALVSAPLKDASGTDS